MKMVWYTETSNQKTFSLMKIWTSNYLTLALQQMKVLRNLPATMGHKATWHQKLRKDKSTTENKLTFFQSVSWSLVSWEVFSHFLRQEKVISGTILFDMKNMTNTFLNSMKRAACLTSSKIWSWNSLPKMVRDDQQSMKSGPTHGCRLRKTTKNKYVKI